MAFFQILSLLNTICNMYMYITCMFLKAIVYAKGRDWCRYRASGRDCGGARGHHLCLTDTMLVKGIMLAAIYHVVRFRLLIIPYILAPGRVAQSVGHLTRKSGVLGSIPGLATYFRFSFRFFKKGSCQLLAKVCARSTG